MIIHRFIRHTGCTKCGYSSKHWGKNLLNFGIFHSELPVDEIMVWYYGKHAGKMFIWGKPIKFSYNSDGYMYNFSPYCVKTGNIQGMHGLRVISEWTSVIPASHSQNCTRFFDKFFTSVDILNMLKMNFKATGNMKETYKSVSYCAYQRRRQTERQRLL
jgi:hypothetical protein